MLERDGAGERVERTDERSEVQEDKIEARPGARSGRVYLPIKQSGALAPEASRARPLDLTAAERKDVGLGLVRAPSGSTTGVVPRHAPGGEGAPAADDFV